MAEPPSIPHAWDLRDYSRRVAPLAEQLLAHAKRCPGFDPGMPLEWTSSTPDDMVTLVAQGYTLEPPQKGARWTVCIPSDIQKPDISRPLVDANVSASQCRRKSLCAWFTYKTIMLAITLAMIALALLVSIRTVAEIQAAAAFSRSIEQPLAAVDECAHIICAGCGHAPMKHVAALRYVMSHRHNDFGLHFEMACAKCCKEYTR
jgi:hypothetical protein